MLNDKHLKVLHYEPDSSKVFSNTDIKGGLAITYHNTSEEYQPIEFFTVYPLLNNIIRKVKAFRFVSLSEYIYAKSTYKFTKKMHEDFPNAKNILSEPNVIGSDIFDRMPNLFTDKKIDDSYIYIYGRQHNQRLYKYINRDYVNCPDNLDKYKIVIPAASGRGEYGEVLSAPVLCEPNGGHTQTFISFGNFDSREEAENGLSYLYTKFLRALLGAKKVTQNNNREAWSMIPLQDFTSNSDINWLKPVHEIDLQLYRKYGLDEKEIEFIETHVKEMA